jgi:putative transposase
MPRRSRVHIDGVPLHIVQRGHNREPCFFAEQDYSSYLHWLGEALGEAECKLHAYVLMTNHVHLLLTPKKAQAVPKLVISLGGAMCNTSTAAIAARVRYGTVATSHR